MPSSPNSSCNLWVSHCHYIIQYQLLALQQTQHTILQSLCMNCGNESNHIMKLTIETSKTYNFSPLGTWIVLDPTSPSRSLFTILILAKVSLIITSWLPLLLPYELNSLGLTPHSIKYLEAGLSLCMLPQGEM